MSFSDIMSHAGLSMYAQVALVIFVIVFIAICIRTFLPSRDRELRETSLLPLDDAAAARVRERDGARESERERGRKS